MKIKWKTEDHTGEIEVPEKANLAVKIRDAWADHGKQFPDCTLCDMIDVEEDFI